MEIPFIKSRALHSNTPCRQSSPDSYREKDLRTVLSENSQPVVLSLVIWTMGEICEPQLACMLLLFPLCLGAQQKQFVTIPRSGDKSLNNSTSQQLNPSPAVVSLQLTAILAKAVAYLSSANASLILELHTSV